MASLCPHSGEGLVIGDAEGHVGHCCAGCRGVWLPRRYIETIALERNFDAGRFLALLRDQGWSASDLPCPEGCGELRRLTLKGIELDCCAACGGIWFDRGEVARLLAQYPPRSTNKRDDGLDASDILDVADIVGGIFDLFS